MWTSEEGSILRDGKYVAHVELGLTDREAIAKELADAINARSRTKSLLEAIAVLVNVTLKGTI